MRAGRFLVAVGMVVVLAGCWPVPGQNADRTSYNGLERVITAETVPGLHQLWTWDSPAGVPIRGPVVSSAGVHVTYGCSTSALDRTSGSELWSAMIPTDPEVYCDPFAGSATYISEPYVAGGPDGSLVIVGFGLAWTGGSGGLQESASWTQVLDAMTGAPSGTPDVPIMAGLRGDRSVAFSVNGAAAFVQATTLHSRPVGGTDDWSARLNVLSTSNGVTPVNLTLGTDHVFHGGYGLQSTQPGSPVQGNGVRSFSVTESHPDCGPIPAPDGSTIPVECPAWVTPTDGVPTAPVLGAWGTFLYTRTAAGTLYVLDVTSGQVLWSVGGLGAAGAPALAGGVLYVPTGDGRVLAFDAAGCGATTCAPLWEASTGTGTTTTTPTVAGDLLYVGSGGAVHVFEAAGCGAPSCGESLISVPGGGTPVVSSGRLYTTAGATLIAYGV